MIFKLIPKVHLGDLIRIELEEEGDTEYDYPQFLNEYEQILKDLNITEVGEDSDCLIESSPEVISLMYSLGRKPTSEYRGWKPTSCRPVQANHISGIGQYKVMKK